VDSVAILAGAPVVGLAVLGLAIAAATGRLSDGYRSVFVTRDPPAASPTPAERAEELVRVASRGGVIAGFGDVHVELAANGYRVTAGSVGVVYPSPVAARAAITRWLTRGPR
jgi:hypothetical protein